MTVVVTASWLLTLLIKAERRCQHFLLGPEDKMMKRGKKSAIRAVRNVLYRVFLYTENNTIKTYCMVFLSKEKYIMLSFISSCSHTDCKCSQNSQMDNTTVIQAGEEKGGDEEVASLCV